MQRISEDLLRILACPQSKAPLVQVEDWLYSTDRTTRRRYPIRDGIPIMLLDESEVIGEAEFDRVVTGALAAAAEASGATSHET